MVILSHDGSLYGDWVSRYALHFATADDDRKLLLLHVCDSQSDQLLAQARFNKIASAAESAGLICHVEMLPLGKSVYRTLRQALPHDPSALLVCGTRVKPRRQAFLTGSVAELLLRNRQCPVVALRVVQPGLLGLPHDLLLPLAGHTAGFSRLWPVFRRFIPQLHRVFFLRAIPVSQMGQAHLSHEHLSRLFNNAEEYLQRIDVDLHEKIVKPSFIVERRVLFTSDWSHQILIEASRVKSQLMLLGVSERSLAHRVIHGQVLEKILRDTPCDIGIYRGP